MKERFEISGPWTRRDILRTLGSAAVSGVGLAAGSHGAIAAPSASDLMIASVKTYVMNDALFVRVTSDSTP